MAISDGLKEYWPALLDGIGTTTHAAGALVELGAAEPLAPLTAAVAGKAEILRANNPHVQHDYARDLLLKAHLNPDAHLTSDGSPWVGSDNSPAAATAGHPGQGGAAAAPSHAAGPGPGLISSRCKRRVSVLLRGALGGSALGVVCGSKGGRKHRQPGRPRRA
jgi:hypothetical protein